MPIGELVVEYRPLVGKGPARRTRSQGKVPGICYGGGSEPIPVAVDPKALHGSLDPQKKRNTVIALKVEGRPELTGLTVMVRDFTRDILSREVSHVDFVRVRLDEEVRVTVPLELIGKPEGVKLGGLLNVVYRELQVAAKPADIPNKIVVDIEKLNIGDAIHVSDLKLGEGVRALVEAGTAIASVVAPKAEKEAAPVAAAEGAAAAPGAPAAAGAAPAAAGAKGAAPAAAAGAKGAAPAADKKEGKK